MTDLHATIAGQSAVFDDEGCPLHFGNPVEELLTMRRAAVVAARSDLGLIELTGPDAGNFLQRLTANDVNKLAAGQGHANLFLNAKGRILAEFRLFNAGVLGNAGAGYLAVSPQACAKPLFALFDKYHFGEKLTIADRRSDSTVIGVYGKDALQRLGAAIASGALPDQPHQIFPYATAAQGTNAPAASPALRGWIIALPVATYGVPGIELVVPSAAAGDLYLALKSAGLPPIGLAALGAASLEAATPRFGADFDDQTLPPEAGLTQAYSLTKGCYIGQEVMARIQTYGHVNKQITALLLTGASPVSRHAEIFDGETKVGAITSSIVSPTIDKPIALAYVALAHREIGKHLSVQAENGARVDAQIVAGSFL